MFVGDEKRLAWTVALMNYSCALVAACALDIGPNIAKRTPLKISAAPTHSWGFGISCKKIAATRSPPKVSPGETNETMAGGSVRAAACTEV